MSKSVIKLVLGCLFWAPLGFAGYTHISFDMTAGTERVFFLPGKSLIVYPSKPGGHEPGLIKAFDKATPLAVGEIQIFKETQNVDVLYERLAQSDKIKGLRREEISESVEHQFAKDVTPYLAVLMDEVAQNLENTINTVRNILLRPQLLPGSCLKLEPNTFYDNFVRLFMTVFLDVSLKTEGLPDDQLLALHQELMEKIAPATVAQQEIGLSASFAKLTVSKFLKYPRNLAPENVLRIIESGSWREREQLLLIVTMDYKNKRSFYLREHGQKIKWPVYFQQFRGHFDKIAGLTVKILQPCLLEAWPTLAQQDKANVLERVNGYLDLLNFLPGELENLEAIAEARGKNEAYTHLLGENGRGFYDMVIIYKRIVALRYAELGQYRQTLKTLHEIREKCFMDDDFGNKEAFMVQQRQDYDFMLEKLRSELGVEATDKLLADHEVARAHMDESSILERLVEISV